MHFDQSFQNRYLLNAVEVKLCLIRSKNIFCSHENANQATNKASLKEVLLFVRKVKPNPSIQLAYAKALQDETAKYPLRRREVKSFTIPRENKNLSKENLFLEQPPTQIIAASVGNSNYNETIAKFSFNFKNESINFICLYRDGVQIPAKALQPNFENDQLIRSYTSLFTHTGQYYRYIGMGISREDCKNGCVLFAFDLTPQLESTDASFELKKRQLTH